MSRRCSFALVALALGGLLAPAASGGDGSRGGKGGGGSPPVQAGVTFAPELVSHASIGRAEALEQGIPEEALPDEAVLDGAAFSEAAAVAAAGGCWQTVWHHRAGLWPYERHIFQQTTWCGNGSVITSRSTSEWPSTGPACNPNWGPTSWRAGGGAGMTSVDVTTRGGFTCLLPNLGGFQYWLWMTIRYYPWGGTAAAGYGY